MDDPASTKPRLPSGKACVPCRRRKHKCDGLRPQCNACLSRRIECAYPVTALERLSDEDLRTLINTTSGGRAEPPDLMPGQHLVDSIIETRGIDRAGLEALLMLRASAHAPQAHVVVPPSPARTSAVLMRGSPELTRARSVNDQTAPVTSSAESPDPEGYFGESSTFAFVSNVQSGSPQQHTGTDQHRRKKRRLSSRTADLSPVDTVSLTAKENTASYELPPKQLADELIDAYFARVHCLYPFVHEQTFRSDYEQIYVYQAMNLPGKPRPLSVALLNMVFAHAAEFCRPLEQSAGLASSFVSKAKHIVFAYMFREESLELVQSLLLMCQFLQSTLELNQCWSLVGLMVRSAISIGLHLNPPASLTHIGREVRKRVWWGCYMIDRTLSMKLGRPPSILSATAFDVDLPLSVDDQYISHDLLAPRQPGNRPSVMMFFNHTIQQGRVIEKVLHELYRPNTAGAEGPDKQGATNSYLISETVRIDGEVVSWWNKAPAHLKDKPDVSDGPQFELQRNVIFLRHQNLRLLIHRQTFLVFCKYDIEDTFQRAVAIASCRVCVTTARDVIEVIHQRRLLNSLWYNLHYVFTSMGVLLSLETLDRTKLDLLGESRGQDAFLAMGMEYLKAASKVSILAARYVEMLERIRMRPSTDPVVDRISQVPGGQNTIAPSTNDIAAASQIPNVGDTEHFDTLNDLQMFQDPGLLDFNSDLLFGTGLPRDFISSDWSVFDTL